MIRHSLGIIGYGNMGASIAKRAQSRFAVNIFDKDPNKIAGVSGVAVSATLAEVFVQTQAILLAVKPQDMRALLVEMRPFLSGKLLISIAAGITTDSIAKLAVQSRVIRVMPNMPALVGKGLSCVTRGPMATDADLGLAVELFDCVGQVLVIEERLMNAVTAISGSGPAYFCYFCKDSACIATLKESFIQELIHAAKSIAFDPDTARVLAEETVAGTEALLQELGLSGEELIAKVASKGGTTEAALAVLVRGGTLVDAVSMALRRAEELSSLF